MVLDYKLLTDPKAEYLIKLRKIFFDNYVVLEFNVTNTLADHVLREVNVEFNLQNDNLKLVNATSINEIRANDNSNCYLIIAKNPEFKILAFNSGDCFMKFKVREVGPDGKPRGAEYDDEYQLEEFSVGVNDYIQPAALPVDKKFEKYWQELTQAGAIQQDSSYQLSYKTLDSSIKSLVKHFGMTVCENSDSININNKYHSLLLSGSYLGVSELLLHAIIGFDANLGCVMKLKSLSNDGVLASNILETVS